ncbi:hypothetical protein G9C98_008398 [Cotesia typhae]|uniref:Uncharacterized protein n=1 Tax=Cotesia typhae TaxID=2053667 RepID=A0A8J5UNE9_9HYME|nr:hypothetical protein G9C98_008398 [Cotesia typhae]
MVTRSLLMTGRCQKSNPKTRRHGRHARWSRSRPRSGTWWSWGPRPWFRWPRMEPRWLRSRWIRRWLRTRRLRWWIRWLW